MPTRNALTRDTFRPGGNGPAVVELDGVGFRRGSRWILDGIDWRIERGGHVALLGANGSGKTTLLKIIAGYEWPTRGSVRVLGRRFGACHLGQLRRHIGWVSTATAAQLPGQLTALQVVLAGHDGALAVFRDFDAPEQRRAGHCLDLLGVGGLAGQRFALLSQGEQQRVLIARALVRRPALLILDEPCAGLDPWARECFLADLAQLAAAADGPTLLLVTHHVEEIGPWVHAALLLRQGRPLAAGPLADVLTDAHLTALLGAPCHLETDGIRPRLVLSAPARTGRDDLLAP